MELRQLQYAIQIAAERNFSRAAEKLHIAQPSLSQQLAKLEKELGVLLFQRNTNSVELTHAGAVFVEKAQGILDRVTQLKKEMEDISQTRKGKLVVGSLPITGSYILPLVLPVFQQKFPEIEVQLLEESTTHLERLTSNGQTDLSLLSLPLLEKSLAHETFLEDEIRLALPPSHHLTSISQDQEIDLKQLKEEPFIVLKNGQGFRKIATELCEAAGIRTSYRVRKQQHRNSAIASRGRHGYSIRSCHRCERARNAVRTAFLSFEGSSESQAGRCLSQRALSFQSS